jgi:hypothetical protein
MVIFIFDQGWEKYLLVNNGNNPGIQTCINDYIFRVRLSVLFTTSFVQDGHGMLPCFHTA